MVFTKPIDKLEFQDIDNLRANQIHESDILDYKREVIDDDSLIKHVSAFANTKGGFIVFGIEETGKGGYPKAILGIDNSLINKERMEQILLSNISPRLLPKIQAVPHQDTQKSILIIQIPDSYLKPHMNSRSGKYYKRYNFEALEMTELEVSDAYRKRFNTYDEIEHYVNKILSRETTSGIFGQIIVIPTILDHKLIEISDKSQFSWLDLNHIDPQPSGFIYASHNDYVPNFPQPSANGIICRREHEETFLEIHRNGTVEYADDFSARDEKGSYFLDKTFCVRLLHTLQFANVVFSRYNYLGNVKIVISLNGDEVNGSLLSSEHERHPVRWTVCSSKQIRIEREWSSTMLETEFSFIAASIMDEIFNHFSRWKCPLFDDKGNYLADLFRQY